MMQLPDSARLSSVLPDSYPFIFVTISGAHLYGFPSPDSDFDLRGVHILPVREVVGLKTGEETIEISTKCDGLELDLVSHDAKKFFLMLLKKNGYVLEQVFSPLVVHTTPEHEELKQIARGCFTKHHSHHYFGFAETQWKLFEKERPRRVKPLLYLYRVLLTGIHLMRAGEVEAEFPPNRLPQPDALQLVRQRPRAGTERQRVQRKGTAPAQRRQIGEHAAQASGRHEVRHHHVRERVRRHRCRKCRGRC